MMSALDHGSSLTPWPGMVRIAAADPWLIILDNVHDAQESPPLLKAHLVATLRSSATAVLVPARIGEHAWHGHVDVHAGLLRCWCSASWTPQQLHRGLSSALRSRNQL